MMSRLAASVLSAVFLFGWCVQAQTSPPAAQAESPDATKVPPANSREAMEMRADIFMARKMYSDAIHQYELILLKSPNDATLYNKIGVAYQQEADLGAAARNYKRAIKLNKSFSSAINNLGTIEYSKKHYGKAIHLYKQAMALHPTEEMGTLYSNLGYAYFADKQFNPALDCFEKAIAIDPEVFTRHGGFGAMIQQRSSTDPGMFNFLLAKTYALQGEAERCAHYLRMARDDGYKSMADIETDPAFAKVIKDPRVQEVLKTTPTFVGDSQKPAPAQP